MDRVKGELDRELALLGAGPVAPDAPVNDLTRLVKKKKKPAPAVAPEASSPNAETTSLGKRKAEDEPTVVGTTEKKARFD
jgi:HAT1-interacting factor 1